MKKFSGRKNLTLAKETIHNLDSPSLDGVGGGTHPIIIVILLTLLLKGDTPN